jgi:23S rRNA (uracil1939-C5)-methyltransferase
MFEKTPWIHIWGNEFSVDYKGFTYGPTSFHQLIPELYQRSLEQSANFLESNDNSLVVDLFCGNGHSMSWWSRSGCRIIGIESSGEAVKYAMINVPEALVLRGQCHHRIKQLNKLIAEHNWNNFLPLLYVNPPRMGLGTDVLNWIAGEFKPVRIAYLSCSAGTLSRDLDFLCNEGYQVKVITPYDFFPNTHHIETLVLLERN